MSFGRWQLAQLLKRIGATSREKVGVTGASVFAEGIAVIARAANSAAHARVVLIMLNLLNRGFVLRDYITISSRLIRRKPIRNADARDLH
jgi:hypothetical protein